MLKAERLQYIHEKLDAEKAATVSQLAKELQVTSETIRRDLEQISQQDTSIIRTHGGAYKTTSFEHEAPQHLRQNLSVELKLTIAEKSFPLINRNDTIFLDDSTTALYLARYIREQHLSVAIITNSLPIAAEFADSEIVKMVLIGGAFYKNSQSFVGHTAARMLSDYHADKCFVSCTGLDRQQGVTDNNEEQAFIRSLMVSNSKERYLLVDKYKLGRFYTYSITPMTSYDGIITDAVLDEKWITYFDSNHVKIFAGE